MSKINKISLGIALLLCFLVSWQVIGPILFDDTVVQDDFRQSMFWLWRNWDSGLFPKSDFLTGLYESQIYRLPLLSFIYALAPFFTDNLVFFSKIFVLVLAIATCFYAYLFFYSLSRDDVYAACYTVLLGVTLYATDHLTVAHARSFIWLFVFAYIYYKNNKQNLIASLLTFIALFVSPIAFLLLMTMEAYSLLFAKSIFDFKNNTLRFLAFNSLAALLLYKVLVPESKAASAPGFAFETFTKPELMTLPEFLPGGRHPLFGSRLMDGTWWANEHWGLGIGFLKISVLLPIAVVLAILLALVLRKQINRGFFLSPVMTLLYSALTLFFAAQFLFPTLYYPSRYLGISSLILSLLLIVYALQTLIDNQLEGLKKYAKVAKIVASVFVVVIFYSYFSQYYFTRYVQINPKLKQVLSNLPKDSVFAAHPLLPDLSLIPVAAKRMVFMDYEHAYPSLNKHLLEEVRRRNLVVIDLTYAASAAEAAEIMRANNISHFIAHKFFYTPAYTAKPSYVEPYNEHLREVIAKNNGRYFFDQRLDQANTSYMLVSLADITRAP